MSPQRTTTGAELRAERVARCLSQQEVADASGVWIGRLDAIERGIGKPPTPEEIDAIQGAIDRWAERLDEEDD
jgi:transcriptional regulator with XRE-family HTH domain